MLSPDEFRALADILRNIPTRAALPTERQHELVLKGIIAELEAAVTEGGAASEEKTAAEDDGMPETGRPIDAIQLLRETASMGQPNESVRLLALQTLLRLAREGSILAVDALYQLAVENDLLVARQAIITQGWRPGRPTLHALFDWFTHLEKGTPYPEESLPLLTDAYFREASADLRRRLLSTAGQNQAADWARLINAVEVAETVRGADSGAAGLLGEIIERYPALRPTERNIFLDQLTRLAARGSRAARDTLALLFIRYEDPRARQIALQNNYLPEDAEQRALFLFLSEVWAAYETLDFDHRLLTAAYENSGKTMRRRLLEHSRHTGQVDWMRGLGAAAGEVRWLSDLTDADWELSIRRLMERDRPGDLWRLAQVAPPLWSAAMLDRLAKAGWQPEDVDERDEFMLLTRLGSESLSTPLAIRPRKSLHAPFAEINCLAMHPSGRLLGAGANDQRIYLWDLPDGKLIEPALLGPATVTRALVFSPDGELVVSAAGDNRIRAFRLSSGQLVKTVEGHRAMIRSLAIHPDGRSLYSGGFDGAIKLWRFPYGAEIKTIRPGAGEVFSMVLGANGTHLISGGADSIVRVWTLPEGTAARELLGHTDTVTHLAASPTSELVASAGRDGMIRLWNFSSGGLIRTMPVGGAPLTTLVLHNDDQVLIGGRSNGELTLWSLSTGQVIDQLAGQRHPVTGLTLSPEGDMLYSATSAGHVNVWDLRTFLAIRLPGEMARPGVAAVLQERLKNPNLLPSEKRWLAFSAELARWRQRFDIELGEVNTIPIGEFDIEL